MHQRFKPKSVKRKIASLKAFFSYLLDSELIEKNPFAQMKISYREPFTLPKTVPFSTLNQLLSELYSEVNEDELTQDKHQALLCDVAVLELLFATGIRVSELCSIRPSDVDMLNGAICILGKGSRERMIQIENKEVIKTLKKYQSCHKKKISKSGFFFVNQRGNRLSEQSVRSMLSRASKQAEIKQHITPHMYWEMPSKQTLILNKNVELKSFDEIIERFKNQVLYESFPSLDADDSVIKKTLVIDRVELGMMQVRKKDSITTLMMVPTWTFFGKTILKYTEPQPGGYPLNENNEYTSEVPGYSYMIINAIDGSIINPVLGY